jgi:hypothetical protein
MDDLDPRDTPTESFDLGDPDMLGIHRSTEQAKRPASQVLHFPEALLDDLEQLAVRNGQDVSWCLHNAWSLVASELDDERNLHHLEASRLLVGPKRSCRIELPLGAWLSISLETERLDRSRSWLMQRVWLLARPLLVED